MMVGRMLSKKFGTQNVFNKSVLKMNSAPNTVSYTH